MAENVGHSGPAVECEAGNQKVAGSNPDEPGEQFETEPPKLRYQGEETPKPTPRTTGAKRPALELSPIPEVEVSDIKKIISDGIKEAMKTAIAELVESVKREIKDYVKAEIAKAVDELKEETMHVRSEVLGAVNNVEERCDFKAKCESELLEQYNRRENVRIIGLPEVSSNETYEQTIEKVASLATGLETNMTAEDISIAHRLPNRNNKRPRHVIVRFARRVERVNMLKNKKNLANYEPLRHVRIFEDMTAPRLKFFNLMKNDPSIERVWSREGTLFYIKSGGTKVHKVTSLYEGGKLLQYNFYDVLNCFKDFNGVFNEQSKASGT